MKRYELTGKGIDHLKLSEVAAPAPGIGEVLVRIRAASLNYRDLMIAKGVYRREARYPLVPLSDGAGEVAAVGPEVTGWKTGDRVMGAFFPFFTEGLVGPETDRRALGGDLDGVLSEWVVLPAGSIVRIPAGWSYEEASTLPCAGLTAWNALYGGGKTLVPGQTVLVLGTGGVSMYAALLASLGGARVIATSRSRAKLEKMQSLGVHDTIDTSRTPDWEKEVFSLTSGKGVDHVVDVVGGSGLGRSLRAVCIGGQVSVIGVLEGTEGLIDTAAILGKSVTVRGIYVGNRRQLEELARSMEIGNVHPSIERVYPFSEARAAFLALEAAGHFGKLVVSL